MPNLYQDPYTWQEAFTNISANSPSPDQPIQGAQFAGGNNVAALLIDYYLTLSNSNGTMSLLVKLYNKSKDTYQTWRIIDIHGRCGGLIIADTLNANLDWLLFSHVDRQTGGN
jgi:hypothetical protein